MAIPKWSMKEGDTRPILAATLLAGGDIVDLTSADTVKFTMTDESGSVVIDLAPCAIVSPATNGQVTYAWGADDTATPGLYQGEFKVTWGDSTVERFPNKTNFQVQILANLA